MTINSGSLTAETFTICNIQRWTIKAKFCGTQLEMSAKDPFGNMFLKAIDLMLTRELKGSGLKGRFQILSRHPENLWGFNVQHTGRGLLITFTSDQINIKEMKVEASQQLLKAREEDKKALNHLNYLKKMIHCCGSGKAGRAKRSHLIAQLEHHSERYDALAANTVKIQKKCLIMAGM